MRLLLDTHAYAWWAAGDRRLRPAARAAIEAPDAVVILSAVVPWELATNFRIGKWPGADDLLADLDTALASRRLTPLPITLDHARQAGLLPWGHRDPFDRLLAAQAMTARAVLVTADPVFAGVGVEVLW